MNTVERFNLQLEIWTVLKVKMPSKISNMFAFSLNPNYIVIMGGMKRKEDEFVPKESKKVFELENRVFAFKTTSMK